MRYWKRTRKHITTVILASFLLLTSFPLSSQAQCPPIYTFTGENIGDYFGMAVSGAGDLNNDGYDDIIVGAERFDLFGPATGRVYVNSGFNGLTLFTLTGSVAYSFFGHSVSDAGDINNDGTDDIIVGAPQYTGMSVYGPGTAYIYSGTDGSLLYTFTGERHGDRFGASVSKAGDINNDGFADVIVGAPGNTSGGQYAGRAYIFYGSTGSSPIVVAASNANSIFTGYSAYESFGYSVSDLGDVNSDGYDDMFVGAYNSYATGKAYVYSGADDALLYTFVGETAQDMFGFSVSNGGDLNGDGLPDLLVGAWRNNFAGTSAGRAYAFFGRSGPFPITINASSADFVFTGEAAGDQFGNPISYAGDINGDGFDDIIVGADGNAGWKGKAYIFSGTNGSLLSSLVGEVVNDQFGICVSGAGDVNNDGYADVIIGARQELNNVATGPGHAYVFACTPLSISITLDIKPRHCPNYIKIDDDDEDIDEQRPGSTNHAAHDNDGEEYEDKKLKVAIVGTSDFDVASVNIASVMLEGIAPIKSKLKDKTQPTLDDAPCACTRAGKDGFVDLELKFSQNAIIATLGPVQDGDEFELTLTGELNDGTLFEGTDCIIIILDDEDDDDDGEDLDSEGSGTIAVNISSYELGNYPNPFNPSTEIAFSLPVAGEVRLEIFNVMGQNVTTLADSYYEAGQHVVTWNGNNSASGIYFYRLTAGKFTETKKMLLLK